MGVVVSFDVFEDFGAGVAGVLKASALKHFVLEGADEGLGPGVVAAVGACGHALAQAGLGQSLAEGSAPVLAAAVAMEDGAVYGASLEGLESVSALFKRNISIPLVLDQVEEAVGTPRRINPPDNIFPGLPLSKKLSDFPFFDQEGGLAGFPIQIDEPDDVDPGDNSDISGYSLPTDHFFSYALNKVSPDLSASLPKRLSALSRTPLYGLYMFCQ